MEKEDNYDRSILFQFWNTSILLTPKHLIWMLNTCFVLLFGRYSIHHHQSHDVNTLWLSQFICQICRPLKTSWNRMGCHWKYSWPLLSTRAHHCRNCTLNYLQSPYRLSKISLNCLPYLSYCCCIRLMDLLWTI